MAAAAGLRRGTAADGSARGAAADQRKPADDVDRLGQLLVARRADVAGGDRGSLFGSGGWSRPGRGVDRGLNLNRGRLIRILQCAGQIGLVPAFAASELGKLERGNGKVGLETFTLNLPAIRGGEAGSRQPDRAAITERNDTFDRALAKALGAEEHGPMVVLQCA